MQLHTFVENRLKVSATEPVIMELDNLTTGSTALENLIDA
jgi:hypothetical protein